MTAQPYSIGSDIWNGLSKVMEEAAEVQQVGAKIIGAGGERIHFDGSDLRERMLEETGDLYAALLFFWTQNGFTQEELWVRVGMKLERFNKWNHEHRANGHRLPSDARVPS